MSKLNKLDAIPRHGRQRTRLAGGAAIAAAALATSSPAVFAGFNPFTLTTTAGNSTSAVVVSYTVSTFDNTQPNDTQLGGDTLPGVTTGAQNQSSGQVGGGTGDNGGPTLVVTTTNTSGGAVIVNPGSLGGR